MTKPVRIWLSFGKGKSAEGGRKGKFPAKSELFQARSLSFGGKTWICQADYFTSTNHLIPD